MRIADRDPANKAPPRRRAPGPAPVAPKRREVNDQDKFLGAAERAGAIERDRPALPPPDFTPRATEPTLAIEGAGVLGGSTGFAPLDPRPKSLAAPVAIHAKTPPWRRWPGDRLAEPRGR